MWRNGLSGKVLVAVLLALTAISASWSLYADNNFVRTRITSVPVEALPSGFDGYRILHISDLHGRRFGREQKRLAGVVRSSGVDAVVFTGDFLDRESPDLRPIAELMRVLPEGTPFVYVLGNSDVGQLSSSLADTLASRGTDVSERPVVIKRGGASLAFTSMTYDKSDQSALQTVATADVVVALTHEQPSSLDSAVLDSEMRGVFKATAAPSTDPNAIGRPSASPLPTLVDFDLLLAGHTHGGQFRLPLLGALYAPGLGFLPPADRVQGLRTEGGRAQFVSTGLGATSTEGFGSGYSGLGEGVVRSARPWLEKATSFRLFNPATVDVLELKGRG